MGPFIRLASPYAEGHYGYVLVASIVAVTTPMPDPLQTGDIGSVIVLDNGERLQAAETPDEVMEAMRIAKGESVADIARRITSATVAHSDMLKAYGIIPSEEKEQA